MKDSERKQVFHRWMADHRGLLFKVVRTFTSSICDRDDLFQQISMQLWESIPTYTGQVAVTTWMYRVALYAATGWCRKERNRRRRLSLLGESDAVLVQPHRPPDPQLEELLDQIARLEEVDRSLALMLLDGFSYRDMSNVLGMTESNVGVRINRIKKRLLRNMSKGNDHEL